MKYPYLTFTRRDDTSLLSLFVEADEVFYIEPAGTDWCFGLVSRRAGATVTVTLGDGALLSGADILQALRIALTTPDAERDAALSRAGLPDHPLRRASWMMPPVADSDAMAYRTYLSTRDLERLLSFPFQPSVASYRRVLLVDATVAPMPGCGLTLPDVPPHWRYMVVYPEGVELSARSAVDFGERLTLTYSAPGRETARHHVTAGKPSPFITYYGAAICVQPLSRLGIELKPLPAPSSGEAEGDAAAKGRRITVIARFDDNRTIRETFAIDPDSSEYSLLRSGSWHGYRARRMAVKAHGDESYMVDLRRAAGQSTDAARPAEVPATELPRQYGGVPHPKKRTSPWLYTIAALLAIILGVVIVAYLPALMPKGDPALAEQQLMTPAPDDSTAITTTAAAPTAADSVATLSDPVAELAEPEPAPVKAAPIPADDLVYLDGHTTWRRSDLKGALSQHLVDLLAKADIDSIVAHPYMASPDCANVTARKIAEMLWQAKGSDTENGNRAILRKLKADSPVDLQKLYEDLARVRPVHPNKTPRPTNLHQ